MKVLHCCLAAFYIDDYGYQENILPKMHQLQGHEVSILASTETFLENSAIGYTNAGSYYTKEGIPITRINYINWLPLFLSKKLRIYNHIRKVLEVFSPEIIFIHGSQFISINTIVSYAKKHPSVKIYVDGHTDFINSGTNWISKNILHGIIYKWCTKRIEPFTKKFYGVLPIRVDFFTEVYGIPSNKVELLVLGFDPTKVNFSKKDEIRRDLRYSLRINQDDFVIITGGKIDSRKKIDSLMETIIELNIPDIILIVFGTPSKELKYKIEELIKSKSIKYIGWLPSDKVYDYYFASDLAIFPGTHSVLWEQAVGVGLPCIFKKWEGMQHVDLNGNCLFIEDENELSELILYLYNDRDKLLEMKNVAEEKGMREFSYYEIAKRAIEV